MKALAIRLPLVAPELTLRLGAARVRANASLGAAARPIAMATMPPYKSFFMYFEGGRERVVGKMEKDHVFVIPKNLMKQLDEEVMIRIHPHLNYTIFRHYNRREQFKTEHEILFLKRIEKDGILIFDGEESKVPVFYCQENDL